MTSQPWVTFDQVSMIRGDRLVLKDLSFTLSRGHTLFLQGANGSGKTTTLKLCAQLLQPTAGKVVIGGHIPIAYLAHTNGLRLELTVEQNLLFFSKLRGQQHMKPVIASLLDELNLSTLNEIPLSYLSCGQQRRVALARLFLYPAKLWLLDEPVSNLDEQTVTWFTEKLICHQENGGAALIACHDSLAIPNGREVYLALNSSSI